MHRFLWGLLALTILIFLGIISRQNEKAAQDVLFHKIFTPRESAGADIFLGYLHIQKCSGDTVWARDDSDNKFILLSRKELLTPGKVYSIKGTLKSDGTIFIREQREHPYRFFKYLFSGLSLPFILFYLFKYLRFSRREFAFYFRREDA